MTYNKFFYKGIPLTEYCKLHNISYSVINSRIYRLKKNKEYKDLSDDELIEKAINFDPNSNRRFYKGVPLKQYCKDNVINYDVVNSKIYSLSKKIENKNLSVEEIIELAIESSKLPHEYKYYYKGKLLVDYCKENNLEYSVIYSRLYKLKEKSENKDFSEEELIEMALNTNTNLKYFYKGERLSKYCRENNLSLSTIEARIRKLMTVEKYKNKDIEEIIELAIYDDYNLATKHYYKEKSLSQYCKENNLNYTGLLKKVNKLKNSFEYSDLDDEKIIAMALKKKSTAKYYYKGKTLYDYCKENGFVYITFISRILKAKKKYPDLSDEQIIERVAKDDVKKKYHYKGMPLIKYCKENGYRYETIRTRIHDIYLNPIYKDLPMDDVVELAISNNYTVMTTKERKRKDSKYKYRGMNLSEYCEKNNISLDRVRARIFLLNRDSNCKNLSSNEIVEIVMEKYSDKRVKRMYKGKTLRQYCIENNLSLYAITSRIEEYSKYEEYKDLSIEEITELAISNYKEKLKNEELLKDIRDNKSRYNVNYDNLKIIMKQLSLDTGLKIIYYFGDQSDCLGNKIITNDRYKEVQKLVNVNDKKELDLYCLIGLFKSGLVDTRLDILEKEKNYLNKIMIDICDKKEVDIDDINSQEFENRIKEDMLIALDLFETNNERELMNLIDSYIKDKFSNYLDEYKENKKNISFNENVHSLLNGGCNGR